MTRNWLGRFRPSLPTRRPRRPAFTPDLVRLEDRSTPATLYVDPSFAANANGDTVTFNSTQPNEKTGVIVGTDGFAKIADAVAKANAQAGSDQILLSSSTHTVDPSAGPLVFTEAAQLTGSGKSATRITVSADTAAEIGSEGAVFRADAVRLDVSALTFDGQGAAPETATSFNVGSAFRFSAATGSVSNVAIKNVIFSDPTIVSPNEDFGYGVVVLGSADRTEFGNTNVSVSNSSFENIGYIGVDFFRFATGEVRNSTFTGRTQNAGYGVEVAEGSMNVLITGNTFTGYFGTSTEFATAAIQVADDPGFDADGDGNGANEPATAAIFGNKITGGQTGLVIGLDSTMDGSTAIIQYNTISGNQVGTITDTTVTVNALFNFFGAGGPIAANNTTASGDNPNGTGNEVGAKTLYRLDGQTPNDGVLIVAPPVEAVPPVTPGQTIDQIAAAAGTAFVAETKFDNIRPTVAITAPTTLPAPFGTAPLSITVTFSEVVTDITKADFTLGGTAPNPGIVSFTPAGDGKTFTVVLTADGPGTLTLAVNAEAGPDANGNFSSPLPTTVVGQGDFAAPTLTITSPAGALPINYTDPFTLTLTFSELVTGLTASDLTIGGTATGGTVQSITPSADGTTYTVVVGGFTTKGTVTLALPANAATDAAGNPTSAAGPITVATADTTAPTISIGGVGGSALPANYSDPFAFQVTFSESVVGFDKTDITVGGTAKGGSVQSVVGDATNTTFVVTVGGFSSKGDVTAAITANAATDAAGNPSTAAGPIQVASADVNPPSVTVTGPGPLPLAYVDPVAINFNFSEPIVGFDRSDVVLSGTQQGGVIQSFTASADNKTFTVTIGGFRSPGSLLVNVAANAATDVAGNPTPVVGPLTVLNAPVLPPDTTPPTLTITGPNGAALPVSFSGGTLALTFTFSESVSGFDKTDVTLGGTATGGTVQSVTTTDNKTFVVTLGGYTGTTTGTVTVALAANSLTDAATPPNGNAAIAAAQVGTFTPTGGNVGAVRGFAVGGDRLIAQPFFQVDAVNNFTVSKAVNPFEASYTGGVRVANADVTGDGVLDVIVGSGVGRTNEVLVYSGTNLSGSPIFRFSPFESSFTLGVFVAAADLNGDGKAEVIVTPDQGGGPRVVIADGAAAAGGTANALASFFGIDDPAFRGGARAGAGDLNNDGRADLFVAAGFQGGPRIAIYDGKTVLGGTPQRLTPDFFGYEDTLRNGAFVDGGDLNGDGFADVVLGSGPGGGPRVRILDGKSLLASNTQTEIGNFFAGDSTNRGGVRVAAQDLDGDGRIDIVTGPGETGGSRVAVYFGKTITASGTPPIGRSFDLFGSFGNGVFVG